MNDCPRQNPAYRPTPTYFLKQRKMNDCAVPQAAEPCLWAKTPTYFLKQRKLNDCAISTNSRSRFIFNLQFLIKSHLREL